jgi:hypothetical protein
VSAVTETVVKRSGPFVIVSRDGNQGKTYFVRHEASGLSIAPQTTRKVAFRIINTINDVSKGNEYLWEALGPAGCQELPAEDRVLAFTLALRARAIAAGASK